MMILPKFLLLFLLIELGSSDVENFTYNGFSGPNFLRLSGFANITKDGLLRLTNDTDEVMGHAFYPTPLRFKNESTGNAFSFSACFVFAMRPQYEGFFGHGLTFVLSHSNDLSGALPSQYLGILNSIDNNNPSNPIVAVELDTNRNVELNDIDSNHVGIDINSVVSVNSAHASYHISSNGIGGSKLKNLSLVSGEAMHIWVDYDGLGMLLNVTLAPINGDKPSIPLLSSHVNLSSVISDTMYVGFSASTGSFPTSHYVLGWSFKFNGRAQELDLSNLPSLPQMPTKAKSKLLTVGFPSVLAMSLVAIGIVVIVIVVARRRIKYAELLDDWELEYGPQRIAYKDLFKATRGFRDRQLLGAGGFGKVYKGVLPKSQMKVAVKKISHESRQGMKEFVAEVVSIGRLRHRNLVQLLGYCRRKGELLLVYDHMPNGSLDKFLFDQPKLRLDWLQRLRIIKGVASGLFYLHEEWEKVVVHRDIKASNILLDGDLNGRLGDFGLARLYDHGTDPQTTHVVGTLGYLAPELPRTGKATTCTDVFAFGGFLLEVACGRRPIEMKASPEEMILVDWVLECSKNGSILQAADPKLEKNYVPEEIELVLKLGLLCSHPQPNLRPRMRLVMQLLNGNAPLPELVKEDWNCHIMPWGCYGGIDDTTMSDYMNKHTSAHSLSTTETFTF